MYIYLPSRYIDYECHRHLYVPPSYTLHSPHPHHLDCLTQANIAVCTLDSIAIVAVGAVVLVPKYTEYRAAMERLERERERIKVERARVKVERERMGWEMRRKR